MRKLEDEEAPRSESTREAPRSHRRLSSPSHSLHLLTQSSYRESQNAHRTGHLSDRKPQSSGATGEPSLRAQEPSPRSTASSHLDDLCPDPLPGHVSEEVMEVRPSRASSGGNEGGVIYGDGRRTRRSVQQTFRERRAEHDGQGTARESLEHTRGLARRVEYAKGRKALAEALIAAVQEEAAEPAATQRARCSYRASFITSLTADGSDNDTSGGNGDDGDSGDAERGLLQSAAPRAANGSGEEGDRTEHEQAWLSFRCGTPPPTEREVARRRAVQRHAEHFHVKPVVTSGRPSALDASEREPVYGGDGAMNARPTALQSSPGVLTRHSRESCGDMGTLQMMPMLPPLPLPLPPLSSRQEASRQVASCMSAATGDGHGGGASAPVARPDLHIDAPSVPAGTHDAHAASLPSPSLWRSVIQRLTGPTTPRGALNVSGGPAGHPRERRGSRFGLGFWFHPGSSSSPNSARFTARFTVERCMAMRGATSERGVSMSRGMLCERGTSSDRTGAPPYPAHAERTALMRAIELQRAAMLHASNGGDGRRIAVSDLRQAAHILERALLVHQEGHGAIHVNADDVAGGRALLRLGAPATSFQRPSAAIGLRAPAEPPLAPAAAARAGDSGSVWSMRCKLREISGLAERLEEQIDGPGSATELGAPTSADPAAAADADDVELPWTAADGDASDWRRSGVSGQIRGELLG